MPPEPPSSSLVTWFGRPRWLRWTAYVAVATVLALVVATGFAVSTVRRSFPQTTGTVRLTGLTAPVTVKRDSFGVPQVYADTAEDLFFAQGFVQAQDRFYEMDVRRHLTAGRLAELFGEDALETDKAVRTMGWRRVAEREYRSLDLEAKQYLEAFSAGVNAYLKDRSPNQMSLEYTLLAVGGLDYQVEEWTPVDSVAWLKAMAWDLRGNVQEEVARALAAPRLDDQQLADLYPDYPYDRHRSITSDTTAPGAEDDVVPGRGPGLPGPDPGADPAAAAALRATQRVADSVPNLVGTGAGVGSNSWVVDGAHSRTGKPILANDPHLAPSLPGVWYQMGLHCRTLSERCPFDVSGFTFAGFPGVIIGHNQEIAWGFTNLGPDVSDLYLEAVDGERYRRGKRWVPFERRQETIKVAGGESFTFTVRSSVHGPLLSDVDPTFASVGANAPVADGAPDRDGGYAVALSWTALRPARTAQAVFALDRATSWEEFREAGRDFAVPAQNMVYADRAGHIGYLAPGMIPVRRPANRGDLPSPGWDPRYDWTGRFVPYDRLPSVLDPEEGFIVAANQAPTPEQPAPYLGDSWDPGYRSQRITDLITRKGTLGVEDMTQIQLDVHDAFAATLLPYLLQVELGSVYYSGGQRLLARWDLGHTPESPAAAYYNAVWRNLLERTFGDQLPPSVPPDRDARWFEVVRPLLTQPNSTWWDDVDTEDVREGRDDMIVQAMRDARDELVRLQARRPSSWTWGHQHMLTLENQTLGQSDVPFVARLLNRGEWEVGGGNGIVDATGWQPSEGYEVSWAPSMRMVVSLADLDDSTWVNLTGASGHAFHDHYTDQTELWATGRTRLWAFTPEAVDEATEDTLRLEPGTS